jgi:hypothetical protein
MGNSRRYRHPADYPQIAAPCGSKPDSLAPPEKVRVGCQQRFQPEKVSYVRRRLLSEGVPPGGAISLCKGGAKVGTLRVNWLKHLCGLHPGGLGTATRRFRPEQIETPVSVWSRLSLSPDGQVPA